MVGPSDTAGAARTPSTVAVIGGGYVGAPTAAMLAHFGHRVVVAESNAERRGLLEAGQSPFIEPGLSELLAGSLAAGNLTVVADAPDAVEGAQFVFICVATPPRENGSADVSQVLAAAREIAPRLQSGTIVINKSTVPIGTAEAVAAAIARDDVVVASNPEFLSEGSVVVNSFNPSRTVIGAEDPAVASRIAELFAPTGAPVVICSPRSAELIKYAANAFLATKISFVNSIARLCDATGASIDDVAAALGLDSRIGSAYLRPGPGWGGPCLPKDTSALISLAHDLGVTLATIEAAQVDNRAQAAHICDRIAAMVPGGISGARIGVLGLTFKSGTGDLRESPAVDVAAELGRRGAVVTCFDPTVEAGATVEGLSDVAVVGSEIEAARDSDAVAVLTEWKRFAEMDLAALAAVTTTPRLFDSRGIVDLSAALDAGFVVSRLGRP
jgi:UDPglucose 6-dehydrogenase